MESRWSDREAGEYLERYAPRWGEALALRVYTSRLIGQDPDLVMHGGGNTSLKGTVTTLLGDRSEALFVKGSGWDLDTIEPPGLPAVDLAHLRRLRGLAELSDEEMGEYRRPFAEPGEGRRPTLTWPRQIPNAGEPADVHAIATEYADWLGTSNVPKLFLKAEPGAILANDTLINLVRGWPALTEKTVAGIHFVQEDSPDEIGRAVAEWMGALG